MGTLILPSSGLVYADTQVLIYSVEKHPEYAPLLRPLWQSVEAEQAVAVSSELALMLPFLSATTRVFGEFLTCPL